MDINLEYLILTITTVIVILAVLDTAVKRFTYYMRKRKAREYIKRKNRNKIRDEYEIH